MNPHELVETQETAGGSMDEVVKLFKDLTIFDHASGQSAQDLPLGSSSSWTPTLTAGNPQHAGSVSPSRKPI